MNESKADIKTIVDVEMDRLTKGGDTPEKHAEHDANIKDFYDACLSNRSFQIGLMNTMMASAKKMAGIMMMEPRSEEEAMKLVANVSVAQPILELVYLGYLFGQAKSGTQSLEEMFGKEMVN